MSTSLEQGNYAMTIFLDLRKASNTVSNSKSLSKLSNLTMVFKILISIGLNHTLVKESKEFLEMFYFNYHAYFIWHTTRVNFRTSTIFGLYI